MESVKKAKYSDIMKALMKPLQTPQQKTKERETIKNNVGGGVFAKLNKI